MIQSPLQRLVSRHVCSCKPKTLRNGLRPLSTTSRLDQHFNPGASSYGSSEFLKRRYQPVKEEVDKDKIEKAKLKRRMKINGLGIAFCAVGIAATILFYPSSKRKTHLDAPPSIPGISIQAEEKEVEQVETGTSTVPRFPKTIYLSEVAAPADTAFVDKGEQEYQLVGVGIRKVFYLEVYVAGLYIAVPDIAKLQERLVRTVDPIATTLVAGERTKLKDILLHSEKGEEVWNEILKDGGIRMVWRIVPTRNTDFVHLRDGWVRGITARTQQLSAQGDQSFSDETFGLSLNEFKTVLGGGFRKKVPWGETILLTRDGTGVLNSWYEDKTGNKLNLGSVRDERISRLLWLIYLGGAKVSSEHIRQSVVEGIMEFVERPVGTVATQVV